MTDGTAERIVEFLDNGGEFETGLALLQEVMPNPFYIANLRRKGAVKGMETVRYELRKKITNYGLRITNYAKKPPTGFGTSVGAGVEVKNEGIKELRNEGDKQARFVLRTEFAFLEREDCPEEFKVLVADMITAHHKYMNWHERLYYAENKGDDECFEASSNVVENYLDNRLMWEELEHYKKTGTILGKHRLFWRRKREEELTKLDPIGLANLYRNYPRNINYYKKRIDEERDNEQVFTWKERLSVFEWEYMIVKRLLHIHDGGLRRNKAGKAKGKGKRR
jgi:hypothetical protein